MRCAVAVAAVRARPDDAAEQVTQALLGEPLAVEEERDGWARVRTAYDYGGWVRASAVEKGEGRLPGRRNGVPLEEARRLLGAPYEWGGLSEAGVDCSGLVHLAYRRLGRLVPRDAWQQEAAGEEVGEPQAGDLLTYGERTPHARADHVAFWVGEGRILHATGRDGVRAVVEEPEPDELRARRRRTVRLSG